MKIKWIWIGLIITSLAGLCLTTCTSRGSVGYIENAGDSAVEQIPIMEQIDQPVQAEIPGEEYPLCSLAPVGTPVTCLIPSAYCSYQPGVNGKPTFCNDARYPNQNFTLLVWNQDWSDFDGQCLLVNGVIELYKGKPEIEAITKSQIFNCE